MLAFRSLALGLVGACFLLLAFRPAYEIRVAQPPPPPPIVRDTSTIIDVAAGVSSAQLPPLIQLAAGEHVVAIDDVPVSGDLDAGAAIAAHDRASGSYLDLQVAGAASTRRVLVLLH